MNRIVKMVVLIALVMSYSCGDFLDVKPKGALTEYTYPTTKEGAERLLIGAYALLDGNSGNGVPPYFVSSTGWIYGSIAGGDAHKGSDFGDQPQILEVEKYDANVSNFYFDLTWQSIYEGINRSNGVLRMLKRVSDVTTADTIRIGAEARALRGIYYLEAKGMWNNVPYVDENTDPNTAKNNTDLWPKIESDLLYAYNHLPEQSPDFGRVNKWAAGSFYAKVLLCQGKYDLAKPILLDVYSIGTNPAGTKFALESIFEDNFDPSTENGPESVFAIQFAVNDGSLASNARNGDGLNWPNVAPFCCGFFLPSSELVNSYRTDGSGLPLLDGSYNNSGNEVKDDQGLLSSDPFVEDTGNLDPRLDWTVGRRGIPYLGYGDDPGKDWIRDPTQVFGPYVPKKNVYQNGQMDKYSDHSGWAQSSSANYDFIRFAEIILWLAECEVEDNNLSAARDYVNEVRTRAANPAGWVKNDDGSDAANYVISPYPLTGYPFDTKANSRLAVHFERKLELAMEGHRFFDLVRWGEATATLSAYLAYESTKRDYLKGVTFTTGKNEYYPIPQHQIDLMGSDILKQNPGY